MTTQATPINTKQPNSMAIAHKNNINVSPTNMPNICFHVANDIARGGWDFLRSRAPSIAHWVKEVGVAAKHPQQCGHIPAMKHMNKTPSKIHGRLHAEHGHQGASSSFSASVNCSTATTYTSERS